jgi:hypothetical protein
MFLRLALLWVAFPLVAQQGCAQQGLNSLMSLAQQTTMTVITTIAYAVINRFAATGSSPIP